MLPLGGVSKAVADRQSSPNPTTFKVVTASGYKRSKGLSGQRVLLLLLPSASAARLPMNTGRQGRVYGKYCLIQTRPTYPRIVRKQAFRAALAFALSSAASYNHGGGANEALNERQESLYAAGWRMVPACTPLIKKEAGKRRRTTATANRAASGWRASFRHAVVGAVGGGGCVRLRGEPLIQSQSNAGAWGTQRGTRGHMAWTPAVRGTATAPSGSGSMALQATWDRSSERPRSPLVLGRPARRLDRCDRRAHPPLARSARIPMTPREAAAEPPWGATPRMGERFDIAANNIQLIAWKLFQKLSSKAGLESVMDTPVTAELSAEPEHLPRGGPPEAVDVVRKRKSHGSDHVTQDYF
ncbi:hypothetical protein FB451DRAFT_1524491 [Mycena latifolia]|nr:hypothetical protein FB451DRAFT_1524491 [Mycena latifolia]